MERLEQQALENVEKTLEQSQPTESAAAAKKPDKGGLYSVTTLVLILYRWY